MKRHPIPQILSILLCVLLLVEGVGARAAERAPEDRWPELSAAAALPEAPEIAADYAILAEAKSGTVLYAKNAYDRAAPASITKVMTALLTAERCDMNDTVLFSYRACHELVKGSSTIARTEGEMMSVRDCLFALLVASANEVAQALAEHVSGSIEAFVALMNDRAEELGCVNTHFANPHGTPDPDHYTCCYDMALIMKEAMSHDSVREALGTAKYQIAPTNKHSEITYMNSKHPLVTAAYGMKYDGAVGGKTGHTSEALNTLVTYAARGEMDLICVVMHVDGYKASGEESAALFNYGFENFLRTDMLAESAVKSADGSLFLGSEILDLVSVGGCYVTLPKETGTEALTVSVRYGGAGAGSDAVAVKEYSLNGVVLARLPLKLAPFRSKLPLTPETVHEKTAKEKLRTRYLGVPLIYWILIAAGAAVLAVLTLILFAVLKILRKNKRRGEQNRRALRRNDENENRFFY